MADITDKKEQLKKTIDDLLNTAPAYSPYGLTTKQKIAEGIKSGQIMLPGFYKNTTAKLIEYRDKFAKKGHNILQNKKKK